MSIEVNYFDLVVVPPSGGSLEIGNVRSAYKPLPMEGRVVPPSGGSLEIGNHPLLDHLVEMTLPFPLRGDP